MTGQEFRSCAMTWRLAAMQARDGKPLARWAMFEQQHKEQEPSSRYITKGKQQDARPKVWEVEDEDFWRENLEPIEFRALREDEWDSKASSLYSRFFPETGYFACRACGLPLFSAESKFESPSGTAVPSFGCCVEQNVRAVLVQNQQQHSSQKRADTQCARCRSHLGHVLADYNPSRTEPTLYFRERHAVNGLAVSYVKDDLPGDHNNDRNVVLPHPPVILQADHKPMALFE